MAQEMTMKQQQENFNQDKPGLSPALVRPIDDETMDTCGGRLEPKACSSDHWITCSIIPARSLPQLLLTLACHCVHNGHVDDIAA